MKKTNFLIILVALCVCAGCGKAENETTGKDISGENETALHDSVIKVDVLHSADKVTVTAGKERKDLNIIQENEYIRNNNNLVSSGNIIPYQDGYYYYVEIKPNDGDNFMLVYDDGKGKVTECTKLSENGVGLEYISDDYVYYYDSYKDSLFREKDGQSERVIEFKYFGGTPRYYAEDGIYYTDINEDKEESYIGKLGYDGTDNGELYKLNVAVEQVFKYQDDLWFVYYKFGGEKNRVGRIHLPDNKVFVYEEITPQGSGPAGNRISFNNGYLYYNSSGLNRLNIQENTLEQVYEDDVQAINFTEDSIWFFTEKNLYKRNKDGVKKIMNVKGETEGFCGIWVDDGKIYIDTYAGGLYNEYYQMDEAGKIVKHWDSEGNK